MWLSRFILEIRKKNGDPYPTLVCGLQRYFRENQRPQCKAFEDAGSRCTSDSEMKHLNAIGNYLTKWLAHTAHIWWTGKPTVGIRSTWWSSYHMFWFLKYLHGMNAYPVAHIRSSIWEGECRVRFHSLKPIWKVVLLRSKVTDQYAMKIILVTPLSNCLNVITPNAHWANALHLTPPHKPKEDMWYSRTPPGHNTLGDIHKQCWFRRLLHSLSVLGHTPVRCWGRQTTNNE